LRNNLNCAKEEVEISPDVWCIIALCEGELGSKTGSVCDGFVVGKGPVGWGSALLGEVDRVGRRCKTGCSWAGGYADSSVRSHESLRQRRTCERFASRLCMGCSGEAENCQGEFQHAKIVSFVF
jgi:hypothetical protein